MRTREEIKEAHDKRTLQGIESGSTNREYQLPQVKDLLLLRAQLHPTAKKASQDLTRRLIKLLMEEGCLTSVELCEKLQCSERPVLKRLKCLRHNGCLRRESKRYYLPTHRLQLLIDKGFLEHIC